MLPGPGLPGAHGASLQPVGGCWGRETTSEPALAAAGSPAVNAGGHDPNTSTWAPAKPWGHPRFAAGMHQP